MANNNPDYLHLASHKFSITCKTCGLTETFYSELSVGYFRLKHAGHELVEAGPRAAPPVAPSAEQQVTKSAPSLAQEETEAQNPEPAPTSLREARAEREEREEREPPALAAPAREEPPTVLKVDRVLVDTRASPIDGLPVIRVRGLREDGRTFARLFKPEEAGKMREFLGSTRFVDQDANLVYTWETDTISFEQDPTERSAPPEPKKAEPRETDFLQQPQTAPPVDSVASSLEGIFPEEAPTPVPESLPAPEPAQKRAERPKRARPQIVETRVERAPPSLEPPAPAAAPPPPPAVVPVPPPVLAPAATEKAKRVEKAEKVEKVEKVDKPKKNHETLLLAKSSYIQEGEESMNEAFRISKVLKAFRWNVEPVYTIGVIVEDNLSVETNKGEISGNLVKQVENAGYKLSAMTVTNGKPTAWFKRRPDPEVPLVDDPERTRLLEQKVEELTRELQEERTGATDQKAVWERRFLLLTNLVRSMREGGPASGSGSESDSQPETDVTS